MKEPSAGSDAVTIADAVSRMMTIILVLCAGNLLVDGPLFYRQAWPQWYRHFLRPVPVVVAYLVILGFASTWLLYRGCRLGVRFDDHGVTVRRTLRTARYSWPEVSHFADGSTEGQGGALWALDIVLSDGHTVTLRPFAWGRSARPKTLATIERVAVRHQIPAELTGKS